MPRFELVHDPSTNPELSRLYREIAGAGFGQDGVPINWFTAQAARPDILAATWALVKGILVEGKLPLTLKEMISLAISVQNRCRYCEVTHTGSLQTMGVAMETIKSCIADPEMSAVPSPYRVAIQFGLKVARAPNSVTEEDYELLRKAGFSREEMLEIAMMAAFTQFINTWADAAGLPLDANS